MPEQRAIVIDVPDVPPEEAHAGDAESRAVAAHPAFQALLQEGRRQATAGETVSADDFFRELEREKPDRRRRITGPAPKGESGRLVVRMPKKLHHELAGQAAREGVSLNRPGLWPRTGSGSNHQTSPRHGIGQRLIPLHPLIWIEAVQQRAFQLLALSLVRCPRGRVSPQVLGGLGNFAPEGPALPFRHHAFHDRSVSTMRA
ncbi:MAG: toxin-antitoxin system HicB family antitoxin [Chloroflexota bacterium]